MRYSLILIAALSAATAFADPQSSGGGQVSMDNLTKALQLDPQQATQVEQILNDERDRLQQLKGSGGGNSSSGGSSSGNSDARAQLQSIHQDTISKLGGVLNDQQMEKFQRMVQERRQAHHGGGQRGAAHQQHGAQQTASSQPAS